MNTKENRFLQNSIKEQIKKDVKDIMQSFQSQGEIIEQIYHNYAHYIQIGYAVHVYFQLLSKEVSEFDKERSSQVAGTTSEEKLSEYKHKHLDSTVLNIMFEVLDQKLNSLILADKYHRHLHIFYIFIISLLILIR